MRAESTQFTYYRPVRAYPGSVPDVEVVVPAPPSVAPGGATAALPYLLPIASSIASVGLLLTVPGHKRPALLAAVVGMVALSAGFALFTHRQQRRMKRRERARYLAHLDALRQQLGGVAAAQREAAAWLYPEMPQLWALVVRRERLWERRPSDDDFLAVRVGHGTVPLECRVRMDLGGDPLAEHDPELLGAARRLVDGATALSDMALVVPLGRYGVVAVTGPPERARALLRSLLTQLAAFHAPGDLRILAAFPPAARDGWSWLRRLPHVRAAAAPSPVAVPPCRLAETPGQLVSVLEQELPPRLAQGVRGAAVRAEPGGHAAAPEGIASWAGESAEPRLLVVLDGFSARGALARLPLVQDLLSDAAAAGVTVLCLTEHRADEPAQLALRIELDGEQLSMQETAPGGRRLGGTPGQEGLAFCEAIARSLAPLRLEPRGGAVTLPLRARLLDLLGIEEVDPVCTWRPRARDALLRVPIGQGPDGEVVVLDLKEAADGGMGPHGLIIGATGAGKSELLRTIVTGLAITHPPELLSFVLVDFKGGAAFAELATLPHTAGMITNLHDDLGMVDRMRAALQGEIERRQRLLRQAGNLDGITRYHAAMRSDPSLPPLPYLLVIVDEFGELLASRPDFLDLFVAIGRLGRSLGIQLLLACDLTR